MRSSVCAVVLVLMLFLLPPPFFNPAGCITDSAQAWCVFAVHYPYMLVLCCALQGRLVPLGMGALTLLLPYGIAGAAAPPGPGLSPL